MRATSKLSTCFSKIVLRDDHLHDLRVSPQVEDILGKLEAYELPLDTRRLLFQYYEQVIS